MTPDEAAKAATTFHAITDNDRLTTELANVPPPPPPPDDPPCGEGGACDQAIGSPASPTEEYQGADGMPTSMSVGMRRRGIGPIQSDDRMATAMNEPNPSCHELAMSIYQATNLYKSIRNDFFGMLRDVFGNPFEIGPDGRPRIDFPNLPDIAMAYDMMARDVLLLHTQLNIMAWMYANQGCWSNYWGVSWNDTYPDYVLACTYEWADISLDGGRTYRTMRVQVCEFRHV